MTLGVDWGYTPHAVFKSPVTVIAKLMEIVAKGGSLLLGVGPTPEGYYRMRLSAVCKP